MAIYRTIHTNLWEDSKVLDEMNIEERYFWLYLLTNPHTNQIGCFEISKRQIKNETDFETKKITELLDKFENELGIINYSGETKELFIKNWYKYNWTKSPKVLSCIEKEFMNIKDFQMKNRIYDTLLKVYGIDRVSIGYANGMYSLGIKQKEKEKEKETKTSERVIDNNIYNTNILDTPTTHTQIFNFCSSIFRDCLSSDLEKSCRKFFLHYKSKNWDGVFDWQSKAQEWMQKDIDDGIIRVIDTSRRLD